MFTDSKKLGLIVGTSAILVLTLLLGWWIMKPSWVPLTGSEGTSDSRMETLQYLMEWGIPFKEDDAGQILIDQSQILSVRNRLSQTGVMATESPGMEIFNESEYGMSEFTQRINYQRAIEGEIAQTIRSFADVKNARVHLTLPKQSIFRDKQTQPKASVVIQAKPGQLISEDQVFGITKLVAASVEDLSPENVIVLDHNGLTLTSDGESPTARKQHSSRNLEILFASKARELVAGIVQTDDIQIAVNTELNLDKIKSVKDQIIPADADSGFIHKTKRQTSVAVSPSSGAKGVAGDEKTSFIEEEFLFSRERSEIEYASGQVKSVSVGIVVVKDISAELISDIEQVVTAGLGLNLERGDRITVVSVQPSPEKSVQDPKSMVSVNPDSPRTSTSLIGNLLAKYQNVIFIVLAISFVVLVILFIFIMFGKSRASTKRIDMTPEEREQLIKEIRAWISSEHAGEST